MFLTTLNGIPKWQQDETCLDCTLCHMPFSFKKRRHHCRCCGMIFHEECCAPERITLPDRFPFSGPQRVCKDCFALVTAARASLNEDSIALQLMTRASQFVFSSNLVRMEEFMPLVPVLQFVFLLTFFFLFEYTFFL